MLWSTRNFQNPFEEEESIWIWSECEGNINFNDLWFAMLGGGKLHCVISFTAN